jgi:hypothetical protein
MTTTQKLIDALKRALEANADRGSDYDWTTEAEQAIAEATAPAIPMVHNKGTDKEVTLRVVLSSEAAGNEYFDHNESLDEALQCVKDIVLKAVDQGDDYIDRIVGIAVVPKAEYGGDTGYGYGLTREFSVSNKDGFAFFSDHADDEACNEFMDDKSLGIDDDGYILNEDDERMTYDDYLRYDIDTL